MIISFFAWENILQESQILEGYDSYFLSYGPILWEGMGFYFHDCILNLEARLRAQKFFSQVSNANYMYSVTDKFPLSKKNA